MLSQFLWLRFLFPRCFYVYMARGWRFWNFLLGNRESPRPKHSGQRFNAYYLELQQLKAKRMITAGGRLDEKEIKAVLKKHGVTNQIEIDAYVKTFTIR